MTDHSQNGSKRLPLHSHLWLPQPNRLQFMASCLKDLQRNWTKTGILCGFTIYIHTANCKGSQSPRTQRSVFCTCSDVVALMRPKGPCEHKCDGGWRHSNWKECHANECCMEMACMSITNAHGWCSWKKNQNWNWLTALGFYSHTILKCTQMTKSSMLMTWKSSESSG